MSVFDFLKSNHFLPFPLKHIQEIGQQLLKSVQFLHNLHIIHTDLKPENILLMSSASDEIDHDHPRAKKRKILRSREVRLIDFGSATFQDEHHSSVVSTRHYRAPEIIFGSGWSYPCDIWSIGCILVEFFTGDALFQTHDNLEHLAMMETVLGKFTARTIAKCRAPDAFFLRQSTRHTPLVNFPNKDTPKENRKFVAQLKRLKVCDSMLSHSNVQDIIPSHSVAHIAFRDLIKRILVFDPERRATAVELLAHPFFSLDIP